MHALEKSAQTALFRPFTPLNAARAARARVALEVHDRSSQRAGRMSMIHHAIIGPIDCSKAVVSNVPAPSAAIRSETDSPAYRQEVFP
jgi:hypothetical protein